MKQRSMSTLLVILLVTLACSLPSMDKNAGTAPQAHATAGSTAVKPTTPPAALPKATKPPVAAAPTEAAEPTVALPTEKAGPACSQVGESMVSPKDGMTLLCVPEGEFLMGSADSDKEADVKEKPQHKVYLDAFWVDKTEVTTTMFAAFLNEKGNQKENGFQWFADEGVDEGWLHILEEGGKFSLVAGFENHPAVGVTWLGAKAYCEWAGRSLPSEAQWEKAARGTDGRTYPWGEGISCKKANTDGCRGTGKEFEPSYFGAPVDEYPDGASPYGALNMAGNVEEWTMDFFSPDYFKDSPLKNPTGPAEGKEYRVSKGGAWFYFAPVARCASRLKSAYYMGDNTQGFRCVLSP